MARDRRPMKMGVCASLNFGSAQQCVNQGEIFLFMRWAVRVVRFAKKQDLWLEQRLPAKAQEQSD